MTPHAAATHLLHLAGRVGTWALYRVVDAWDAADTRLCEEGADAGYPRPSDEP